MDLNLSKNLWSGIFWCVMNIRSVKKNTNLRTAALNSYQTKLAHQF